MNSIYQLLLNEWPLNSQHLESAERKSEISPKFTKNVHKNSTFPFLLNCETKKFFEQIQTNAKEFRTGSEESEVESVTALEDRIENDCATHQRIDRLQQENVMLRNEIVENCRILEEAVELLREYKTAKNENKENLAYSTCNYSQTPSMTSLDQSYSKVQDLMSKLKKKICLMKASLVSEKKKNQFLQTIMWFNGNNVSHFFDQEIIQKTLEIKRLKSIIQQQNKTTLPTPKKLTFDQEIQADLESKALSSMANKSSQTAELPYSFQLKYSENATHVIKSQIICVSSVVIPVEEAIVNIEKDVAKIVEFDSNLIDFEDYEEVEAMDNSKEENLNVQMCGDGKRKLLMSK